MPKNNAGHLISGIVSPTLGVPTNIKKPEYVGKPAPAKFTGSDVKTPEQIEKIRAAGKIAAGAIEMLRSHIAPGVTTDELDKLAHQYILDHGAYPSALGYRGFPKSICTSLNEVICHGIPDDTELADGDIVNIDITAFLDGYHGDLNHTIEVGNVSEDVHNLVVRTKESLERGMLAARPGRAVNTIGLAIENYAKRFGYGVVRDFTGHGVGEAFHSGLIIPHYDSAPKYDTEIQVGMVFTIEPMLTLGTFEWDMWTDGWTVTTKDKSFTAQFEHTIAITEDGVDILTLP
ncbi:MAG: type methionyl aminopeptidase [Actinomycetota bacterium]|jgi:methionyl aminopeptidase